MIFFENVWKTAVPDAVYVRTMSQLSESTSYYNDTTTYLNALNLKFGLALASQTANGQPGQIDYQTAANENTVVTLFRTFFSFVHQQFSDTSSSANPDFSSWAGNVDVDFVSRQMSNNEYIVTLNSMETALYQIVLGPTLQPRASVTQAIQQTLNLEVADQSGIRNKEKKKPNTTNLQTKKTNNQLRFDQTIKSQISLSSSINMEHIMSRQLWLVE